MKQIGLFKYLAMAAVTLFLLPAQADETCMSPYIAKIQGQEDYVYVWTLGVEGVGDEQDKLVTIDTNPGSDTYGKVVHSLSVGGRNEAHHSGLSDDRNYLWAGGLDTNKIFVFDIHTDPRQPVLHKVITDFVESTGGLVGPHTFYALPGRMMITALSNNVDHGGRTGMAEYNNSGEFIATHWIPTDANLMGAVKSGKLADGYGYDVRVRADLNIMLTSSFTGWSNYMMDFGAMLQDSAAMQRFGNTMVVWDMHARKPLKVFDVPGAPLEIRCAWDPDNRYCFTSTALTSKIWLIYEDDAGEWQTKPRRGHRRSLHDSSAGGHLDHRGRQGAVGRYVHGRQGPVLRHLGPSCAQAGLRESDRQPDQYGLPKLGREAGVLLELAARELGQDRRCRRAVREAVSLGRRRADAPVDGRLLRGGSRALAPDAFRRVCPVWQTAFLRRNATGRGGSVTRGAHAAFRPMP